MPMFVGAWMELLDQVRGGRRLDRHIRTLRQWLVSDPLSLVPKSQRARAELKLRTAEYLAMIGQDTATVSRDDLQKQEQLIMDARQHAEDEAKDSLERDEDQLRNETASKLDVARLAVDLLSLGRTWSEHFNEWSASQEIALGDHRTATQEDVRRLEREMVTMRTELTEQMGRLSSLVEQLLRDKV